MLTVMAGPSEIALGTFSLAELARETVREKNRKNLDPG